MITTTKHAREVQQRRHDAGKRGFAKAVRRFARRKSVDLATLKAKG